jgi:hypothetical protein
MHTSLIPIKGRWIGKIYNGTVEAAEVEDVVFPSRVADEVSFVFVCLVYVAVDVEVGVDVAQHADVLLLQTDDGRVQIYTKSDTRYNMSKVQNGIVCLVAVNTGFIYHHGGPLGMVYPDVFKKA